MQEKINFENRVVAFIDIQIRNTNRGHDTNRKLTYAPKTLIKRKI